MTAPSAGLAAAPWSRDQAVCALSDTSPSPISADGERWGVLMARRSKDELVTCTTSNDAGKGGKAMQFRASHGHDATGDSS